MELILFLFSSFRATFTQMLFFFFLTLVCFFPGFVFVFHQESEFSLTQLTVGHRKNRYK